MTRRALAGLAAALLALGARPAEAQLPAAALVLGRTPARTALSERLAAGRPAPRAAIPADRLRDSLVALVRAQIGRRYVFGGTTPEKGFDCSGLVKYVMESLEVELPRTAAQQARRGAAVPRDTMRLRPGDLLTFGSGSRISHIGIYVGDGRMVHASSKAGRVIETAVVRPRAPLIKPWRGARRVIAAADSAAPVVVPAASTPDLGGH